MIRLGLMGCGTVAGYGHLPAIRRTPGLHLAALFDPDAGRLREAAARFGVPREHAFIDATAFFRSDLDAVVVTSPAPAHPANVRLAAEHGAHVLCEKPLALSESDARAMIDRMASAGRMLFVAFVYRFGPCAAEIRRLVSEGAIGRLRSMRLIYNWNCHGKCHIGPDGAPIENARRAGRMREGGPMIDCGVHLLDLAHWWTGSEVVRHAGFGAWVDEEGRYDAPDHVWAHLDHADGTHAAVEVSYSYCHTVAKPRAEFVYELIGTEGVIRYDREARRFELRAAAGTRRMPFHEEKGFDGMYAEFEGALRAGDPGNMPTGADGLEATRLARAVTDEAMRRRTEGCANPR